MRIPNPPRAPKAERRRNAEIERFLHFFLPFYRKMFQFVKFPVHCLKSIYQHFSNKFLFNCRQKAKVGDWGKIFQSLYILLSDIFLYFYKLFPIPPKIPESLENTRFLLGDFAKINPPKGPQIPENPPRAKKFPARLADLAGRLGN